MAKRNATRRALPEAVIMPRPYTVTINEELLTWLIALFRKHSPAERLVLLSGRPYSNKNAFYLSGYYEPEQKADEFSVTVTDEEIVKAHAWAAKQDAFILGMCHNHCYKRAVVDGTIQSRTDAVMQEHYKLPLSVVFALWPKSKWWLSAWLMNYAAALDVFVQVGRKSTTLNKWSTRK